MKTKHQLFGEMSQCKTDSERYVFLMANGNNENMPPLMLDNDDTFISFDDGDDWEEDKLIQFEQYLGWQDGVFTLLKTIGIKCESL